VNLPEIVTEPDTDEALSGKPYGGGKDHVALLAHVEQLGEHVRVRMRPLREFDYAIPQWPREDAPSSHPELDRLGCGLTRTMIHAGKHDDSFLLSTVEVYHVSPTKGDPDPGLHHGIAIDDPAKGKSSDSERDEADENCHGSTHWVAGSWHCVSCLLTGPATAERREAIPPARALQPRVVGLSTEGHRPAD